MTLDIMTDLETIFDGEFACEAVLWPGESGERKVSGLFNEPAVLAELGGQVGHDSMAPSFKSSIGRLAGVGEKTPVRILAAPKLGIYEDRNYTVKRGPIPAGMGASIIEFREA